MKNKNTKGLVYFVSLLLIGGGIYLYLTNRGKNNKQVEGKSAIFAKDGFVYVVGTKAQSYPKKKGDYAGSLINSYDKQFWLAYNSSGQQILLKKSDITIKS
jgi:hypothetical protein